jgi:DNA-binding Lrp family transcriptional regulator
MGVKIVSFLKVNQGLTNKIIEQLKQIPLVSKIQSITGEYDLLLEISAPESEGLAEIFSKSIDTINGIKEIHSHLILKTWEK